MEKIKIKRRCGTCFRVRPLNEFKGNNSRCETCVNQGKDFEDARPCLKCDSLFAPTNKHNRICSPCKDSESWSTTLYSVEI